MSDRDMEEFFQTGITLPGSVEPTDIEDDGTGDEGDELEKREPGSVEITKIDEDQHMVWGWASVATVGGQPVVDTQGDQIDMAELRKAAHDFMVNHRAGHHMHDDARGGIGEVVESVVLDKAMQDAMGIDLGMEGWWIGVKVHDDAVWNEVKVGKLKAFSIGGSAQRVPIGKAEPSTNDVHIDGAGGTGMAKLECSKCEKMVSAGGVASCPAGESGCPMLTSKLHKANPNHDAKGRFTTGEAAPITIQRPDGKGPVLFLHHLPGAHTRHTIGAGDTVTAIAGPHKGKTMTVVSSGSKRTIARDTDGQKHAVDVNHVLLHESEGARQSRQHFEQRAVRMKTQAKETEAKLTADPAYRAEAAHALYNAQPIGGEGLIFRNKFPGEEMPAEHHKEMPGGVVSRDTLEALRTTGHVTSGTRWGGRYTEYKSTSKGRELAREHKVNKFNPSHDAKGRFTTAQGHAKNSSLMAEQASRTAAREDTLEAHMEASKAHGRAAQAHWDAEMETGKAGRSRDHARQSALHISRALDLRRRHNITVTKSDALLLDHEARMTWWDKFIRKANPNHDAKGRFAAAAGEESDHAIQASELAHGKPSEAHHEAAASAHRKAAKAWSKAGDEDNASYHRDQAKHHGLQAARGGGGVVAGAQKDAETSSNAAFAASRKANQSGTAADHVAAADAHDLARRNNMVAGDIQAGHRHYQLQNVHTAKGNEAERNEDAKSDSSHDESMKHVQTLADHVRSMHAGLRAEGANLTREQVLNHVLENEGQHPSIKHLDEHGFDENDIHDLVSAALKKKPKK